MEALLESVERSERGKNAARRLRQSGKIPAVLYGAEEASKSQGISLAVDPKELFRILHTESGVNTIIALQMGGGRTEKVLVKDFQLDPVTHDLIHADFYRFAMDKPIQVTVQVLLHGQPVGVKQQGGLLDFVHREIELECLPADIPEHIDIDVTELSIGQGVRLRDLTEGKRWTPITDPDTLIVHVIAPRLEEEPAAEAVEAAATVAEPEVIKKGKADADDAE